MTKESDPILVAVRQGLAAAPPAAAGRGRGSTSDVYRWMWRQRAALAAEFAERRADWRAIAEALTKSGFLNGRGGRITAAGAQQTWKRVTKKARMAEKAGAATPPSKLGTMAPGITAGSEAPTAAGPPIAEHPHALGPHHIGQDTAASAVRAATKTVGRRVQPVTVKIDPTVPFVDKEPTT
jgi:hypothetical protein